MKPWVWIVIAVIAYYAWKSGDFSALIHSAGNGSGGGHSGGGHHR